MVINDYWAPVSTAFDQLYEPSIFAHSPLQKVTRALMDIKIHFLQVCRSKNFNFCRYAGLDRANAERIAKFEAETKAMLTQRSEVVNTRSSLAKSSSDLAEGGRGQQQQQGEIEGW